MPVRNQRLATGVSIEFHFGAPVPQSQGQHAHERAIAIVFLAGGTRLVGWHEPFRTFQSCASLDTAIEILSIGSEQSLAVPKK
jgi:hypothetical protein